MALPADMVDDTRVYPAMEKMLICLEQTMAERNLPEPCRKALYPGGETPLDVCGCGVSGCGMIWVRLVNGFDSTSPPLQSATSSRCGGQTVFTLEVGVARCAPAPDQKGNPPSVEDLWEATRLQMADMAAAKRAITCCFTAATDEDYAVMLGAYSPLPPSGDCVGGSWQVTLW